MAIKYAFAISVKYRFDNEISQINLHICIAYITYIFNCKIISLLHIFNVLM